MQHCAEADRSQEKCEHVAQTQVVVDRSCKHQHQYQRKAHAGTRGQNEDAPLHQYDLAALGPTELKEPGVELLTYGLHARARVRNPPNGYTPWKCGVWDRSGPRIKCVLNATQLARSGYRDLLHEVLSDVRAIDTSAVSGRYQSMSYDTAQHRLDILGNHVLAAFHQRPGTCGMKQR